MTYGISPSMRIFVAVLFLLFACALWAQTPVALYSFAGGTSDVGGPQPYAVLTQGTDGNFYGTSSADGANGNGGIFKVTPAGSESLIYSFASSDGSSCNSGLTLGSDGNFYGACTSGGTNGAGTVYKVSPSGTFTLLHAFIANGSDGQSPSAPPIEARDGNFYGTTQGGGTDGNGAIYKVTPSGTETVIASFGGLTYGLPIAPLVLGADGNLYGSCQIASNEAIGNIFKVTTGGKLTVIYTFLPGGSMGTQPIAALVQGSDGNFYGSTYYGGTNNEGVLFKVTPGGKLTVLHSFSSATDGQNPQVAMAAASDGNFYGVTFTGGANNLGTLYKLTSKGVFSVPYTFDGSVRSNPASLMQHTGGVLYGVTRTGGTDSLGLAFSANAGAPAFASLVSTAGKEQTQAGILGQGFTSGSVVKFGGTQATKITLTGTTFISATVPTGALTGTVTVTAGKTTLTSRTQFHVTPTIKSFNPTSGTVGTPVTITGTGLLQATKVTFNGTSATFTVTSDSQISTSVPTGATTGRIAITTNGGTAISAQSFTVN